MAEKIQMLIIAVVCICRASPSNFFKALGQGSGTPSPQAYVVKTLDKSRAGVATSTIMIGQNVGNAIAPIIGSFFVTAYGYEKMFCGYGGILLGAGMLILCFHHKRYASKNPS